MDTLGQVFRDNLVAARTHLRRVVWVNSDTHPTSFRRFVGRVLSQLSPRSIIDTLIHTAPVAILHLLNVQVLKGDDLKFVHQASTQFVRKVFAPVGNASVDVLNDSLALVIFGCTLGALAQSALRLRQHLLILAKEAGIGKMLASRQGSKVCQTNIYANDLRRWGEWFKFDFTREASIPVAQGIPSHSQGLDCTLNGSVEFDLNIADLGQIEPSTVQELEARLRIRKAIVPSPATKARITRGLICFRTAKEGLKSQVNTGTGILQGLRVSIEQKRMFALPVRKHLDRIVTRYRALFLLPGIFTGCKSLIVDPTASIERLLHRRSLCFGWIESVLKCPTHSMIITHLCRNVKCIRREAAFITAASSGGFQPLRGFCNDELKKRRRTMSEVRPEARRHERGRGSGGH